MICAARFAVLALSALFIAVLCLFPSLSALMPDERVGMRFAGTPDRHQIFLTSQVIQNSMVPSTDLPLVDVQTDKIPDGMTERGTSFYIGGDLWISARHVTNNDCNRIIMIVDGTNVDARIVYLDENADLAILRAPISSVPALALADPEAEPTDMAYAFGYPQGTLGGTADEYLGRTRLKLGGRLTGTAPVLAWTEIERSPADFDSIAGISGGPVIDENGYVIGVIVAASVRRGRNYTVAPEILVDDERKAVGGSLIPRQVPARDVVLKPVSLDASAKVMARSARIAETYCIPN